VPYYYREARTGETESSFGRRLAQELDAFIVAEGPETVGAFIAEPVMGAGGVIVPPDRYLGEIQAVLRKHDVLSLVDEVICGFGRLGAWFGTGRYGLKPDLMSFAKGLTSGYFPLSAIAVSDNVWHVLSEGSKKTGTFAHGFTYSGHPVGAAVALANLDIMEGEGLVENAAHAGAHLLAALRDRLASHPKVREIRGAGLIAGIEFVKDGATKAPFDAALGIQRRVADAALREGLIVRPLVVNGVIALSPPLTLTMNEAELIAERLAAPVNKALQG
jgi:L-2,4-diaminobutyrate transaminase